MNARELRERAVGLAAESRSLLIGGQLRDEGSGGTIESVDPTTGSIVASLPLGGEAEIDEAVRAARRALEGAWGALPASRRGELLWAIADALSDDAESFALIDSLDNGKPLALAREDVSAAVEHFRYMAGWATKINGRTMEMGGRDEFHAYTLREPVGVVGQIIPWNFPIVSIAWKTAPALAAGCAVVLKPSEETSLSALRFAALVRSVGLPAGALNIVTGRGSAAGEALVRHPGVDRISFTGSVTTGKAIARLAVDTLKRVTLELGGKSPVVILPDADLPSAIQHAAEAVFYNQGEVCTAGSRLLVHEQVFDEVAEGVAARARAIRLGDGMETSTEMGPLVSEGHREKVFGMVREGLEHGAELLAGGSSGRVGNGSGFFFEPTVLVENDREALIAREEFFGPVLVAQRFSGDLERVVSDVNSTPYGLGASIFTRDLRAAHLFARRVKAGTVWVNTHLVHEQDVPFGGYKASGYGRELGEDAVLSYTELKSVKIALSGESASTRTSGEESHE